MYSYIADTNTENAHTHRKTHTYTHIHTHTHMRTQTQTQGNLGNYTFSYLLTILHHMWTSPRQLPKPAKSLPAATKPSETYVCAATRTICTYLCFTIVLLAFTHSEISVILFLVLVFPFYPNPLDFLLDLSFTSSPLRPHAQALLCAEVLVCTLGCQMTHCAKLPAHD